MYTVMADFWQRFRTAFPSSKEQFEKEIEQLRDKAPIPTLWLFGKTGSGKSSLIRYLTGAEDATVGEGYRPETKTSRRFDFPDPLEPLMTFLDTRGLGEAAYDPADDIHQFEQSTQLMVVTVRVNDHSLQGILEPLRRIRKSAPQRPVLLVLTCLHLATAGVDITASPDPFSEIGAVEINGVKDEKAKPLSTLPESLKILIEEKKRQFAGLFDVIVPVDLTKPEDGFSNPHFGGERLKQAILDLLPQAYRHSLISLEDAKQPFGSYRQKRARWQVLASSTFAATAGAVPIPWVDIPVVLGIQAHMAYAIAEIYEQEITPANWAILSGAAGSRIAMGMAVREFLKFIPFVGMAAGAASSFAFTYALGSSWDWYFADIRHGKSPSEKDLKEVFANQLKRGQKLWGTKQG